MKTSELFRKTLKQYLDDEGHGSQAWLADDLGMDRKNLNAFLNGRKMLSESKREEIAEKLGYSYVDFLLLGIEMLGKNVDKNFSTIDDEYQMLLLGDSIEALENFIPIIFYKDFKISPETKAKIIIRIYNIFSKNIEDDFESMFARKYKLSRDININTLTEVIKEFDGEDKMFEQMFEAPLGMKAHIIATCYDNPEAFEYFKNIKKNFYKQDIKSNVIDITRFFKPQLKRAA